jgi:Mg-chelatase subunit ChlI
VVGEIPSFHRNHKVTNRAARAYCAFDGRSEVTDEDVGKVRLGENLGHPWVLFHRNSKVFVVFHDGKHREPQV